MMRSLIQSLRFLVLICIGTVGVYADAPPPVADFTGDGNIDLDDFSVLSFSWMTSLAWYPDGLLPQMISHWSLDQDAMDSQSMFDGVAVGNPVWYVKKNNPNEVKIGNGSVGLGGQDYIDIEASGFPHCYGSLTLEVWFRTSYSQETQMILSKGDTSWQIGIEGGTGKAFFSCYGLSGAGYLSGNTLVSDGIWHHLAGVYDHDRQMMYLYLDGFVDGSIPASGQIQKNNLNIRIGSNPQTGNEGWHGILDDIYIYNYALTREQIFNRTVYHVNVVSGLDVPDKPDPEWGKGKLKAFKTIQHAIDVANDGDIILVWPGIYQESLFFMGKAVTIRSAADAAVLRPDPADGIAVTFMYGEQCDSVLEHVVIISSDVALWIHQSSPTLRHLTVVNNDYGVESIFNSLPIIEHCIFWNNASGDITWNTYAPFVTYSCVQQPCSGLGNISNDPLFVNPQITDPNTMDFHLRSEYGRYISDGNSVQRPLSQNWITDNQTSPCIDAGKPDINPFCETMYNDGRINMGAYGNTPFASKSPWILPADMDYNGRIFLEDCLLFSEQWLNTTSQ